MEKKEYNNIVLLIPSEGMYLYNGDIIGKRVQMSLNGDVDKWQEISIKEGNKILSEKKKKV